MNETRWYVMLLERGKTYNKMTKAIAQQHVDNIRALDDAGKLALCGAFRGYPGMAGMLILQTETREEAEEICRNEPLVALGYATYKLRDFLPANRENNYLM